MLKLTRLTRPIVYPLIYVFLIVTLPMDAVHAAMIGTETILAGESASSSARQRVESFFQRQDVQRELRAQGIDPEEALSRVGALTDAEVEHVAGQLDRLPAGEGAVGTIVGAALVVFIVLLITDILGFTDVFPFVRR